MLGDILALWRIRYWCTDTFRILWSGVMMGIGTLLRWEWANGSPRHNHVLTSRNVAVPWMGWAGELE